MMKTRSRYALGATFLVLTAAALTAKSRWLSSGLNLGSIPVSNAAYSAPSLAAKWPWPQSKTRVLSRDVSQTSFVASDGTALDLFDFDFGANSRLRWEIFDQDEDDAKPLDNHVLYWDRNVARATKELNFSSRGPVLAAWNGAFFGYNRKSGVEDAFHVSPVVLRGKVRYFTANHRWTFGVKNTDSGPVWKTFFKPNRQVLEREFDFAAGSVQCLIKNGKPLKMEPFPPVGGQFKSQPVPSTPSEAGHIPYFDHMRTCRASIGWSRDNKHLYFLAVKEPDSEAGSSAALSMSVRGGASGLPSLSGGWTVADVQRFWVSKGVWGAINSDAGDVLQWVARQPKGDYEFVPPRQETGAMRLKVAANWNGAVKGGGAIMYFLVREAKATF